MDRLRVEVNLFEVKDLRLELLVPPVMKKQVKQKGDNSQEIWVLGLCKAYCWITFRS